MTPPNQIPLAGLLTLWRIEGHESGDSSGGWTVVYALTAGDCTLPDPHKAITEASDGKYSFCVIDDIQRVGRIYVPPDADPDSFADSVYRCVNQTPCAIDAAMTDMLGRIIYDAAEERAERPFNVLA